VSDPHRHPAQTVREACRAAQRERVQLVSITLDPDRDTPEVLRAYASARTVDRGLVVRHRPAADVDRVARAYGVGSVRQPSGEIEHTVATFLIDRDGKIVGRYLGTTHRASGNPPGTSKVLL
jgi:protein SCO1/2